MLKKETIKTIAEKLKIKEADLTTAITADAEVDLAIDENLSVLTEDELSTLKKNNYNEGKKAGPEMEVDKVKKELGLDFAGKTVSALVDAVSKKAVEDAKIEPDKKVTELQEKLNKAQDTAKDLQTKLTEKETEVSTAKTQGLIVKDIPANTTLPAEKVLLLMKADGYDYKNEEGKIVWYKDGKALTDKLGNNLATSDVATEYATTNKLLDETAPAGGRGGKDQKPPVNVFSKLSEVKAKFKAEGKSELGDEFRLAVQEAAKVEGFDMNA